MSSDYPFYPSPPSTVIPKLSGNNGPNPSKGRGNVILFRQLTNVKWKRIFFWIVSKTQIKVFINNHGYLHRRLITQKLSDLTISFSGTI